MPRLRRLTDQNGNLGAYLFWCPGCKYAHPYTMDGRWTFNGDMNRPTFAPSLLVYAHGDRPRCHLFLTDGRLSFCSDSDHDLKGQTVDLPAFPWED